MNNIKKFFIGSAASAIMLGAMISPAFAEALPTVDFESFSLGSINGQDGWTSTGASGSGCAVYDHAVNSSLGTTGFGIQSLRISNAVTSGCFGDQTFSKSLVNEAGEADSTSGGMSGGTRQTHFEAQFDFASTQLAEQPGLFVSVSPDRGDGSRMSYLGFDDTTSGIDVIFYDVQGENAGFQAANFVSATVATGLSRAVKHTAKFVIDYVNGPSNDVVKIYIDGILVHTGTTWENYYRFDTEASAEQTPRTTDDLLFRTGGTAAAGTSGGGFLFDNLSLFSGPSTVTVTIDKYIDDSMATALSANSSAFPMSATWNATNIGAGSGNYDLDADGFNGNTTPYQAITSEMTTGADYTTNEVTGGSVVGASCTTGQPYALVGYTTGNTLSEAQGGTPSSTIPTFTELESDKYVIVWNITCPVTTPTPNPYAIPAECLGITGLGAPIIGTNGSNVINGTSGNDLIFALGGSDVVNGKAGHDCIVGGDGSDAIHGDNGDDVILGGEGSDAIQGGAGNDWIYGQNGSDSLKGAAGNDHLFGGNGSDSLKGDGGTDNADGGNNSDACNAETETTCEA